MAEGIKRIKDDELIFLNKDRMDQKEKRGSIIIGTGVGHLVLLENNHEDYYVLSHSDNGMRDAEVN